MKTGSSTPRRARSSARRAASILFRSTTRRKPSPSKNNLIKQWKPRYNILLRDDKTYPYIKLTAEKYPRVYVTRRLRKDGATYFGPYFPGNLAHRLAGTSFIATSWFRPAIWT